MFMVTLTAPKVKQNRGFCHAKKLLPEAAGGKGSRINSHYKFVCAEKASGGRPAVL